jgi:RHS repeat-associated protein
MGTAASSDGSTTLEPQYDAAGNLTQLTKLVYGTPVLQFNYGWDEVGNLASAARADNNATVVSESYGYVDRGSRVRLSTTWNGQTLHTVNVFDSVVLKNAPFDTADNDYVDDVTTEQLYLGGGLAHVFYDGTGKMPHVTAPQPPLTYPGVHTFLSLRDPLGSSAFVVDQDTGELVERTAYLAYGALDVDFRSERWQAPREDVKYTDHWDNAEVGLLYFGARYYSPQLGRFISPDPLAIHGFAGDPNPYAHAFGSPLRYVDPFGLDGADEPAAQPNPAAPAGDPGIPGGAYCGPEVDICEISARGEPRKRDDVLRLPEITIVGFPEYQYGKPPPPNRWLGPAVLVSGETPQPPSNPAWKNPMPDLNRFLDEYLALQRRIDRVLTDIQTSGVTYHASLPGAGVDPGIVYRGLAAGEDATAGLAARAPGIGNSVASHVAGARASQWISTTRSLDIATGRFGQYGVVGIDLSKVPAGSVVDLTGGIPGLSPNTMLSRWAVNAQELLILDEVPAEAIFMVLP